MVIHGKNVITQRLEANLSKRHIFCNFTKELFEVYFVIMISIQDIFPIGIGTWGIGGFVEKDPAINAQRQVDAMAHMFNIGMNFVEANMWYAEGYSVELLAQALKQSTKSREDIFICQAVYLKEGNLNTIEPEINTLLTVFDTDYIDTVQLTQSTFLQYDFKEIAKTVNFILSSGKARYTSITNENLPLLKQYHKQFGNKLFSHEVCINFELRENETEGTPQYAKEHNILTTIYQPLRRNRTAQRNWPLLVELAEKYDATQNQIILNWLISKGYLPLTKSESILHINEHIAALQLNIEQKDLNRIDSFVPSGYISPLIDWNNSGEGTKIDQLSNVFDDILP
jgi:2,5-diketo-D-gluconate reductase B